MAVDFATLDTSQRQKLLGIAQQLADQGLSDADIARYFQQIQTGGAGALQQYYNQAATTLGQQFQPQFTQARNFLGSQPLLADSGYANRLNRQLVGDLYGRISDSYGGAASQMAMSSQDALRQLIAQRLGYKQQLLGGAYQQIIDPRRKQSGLGGFLGGALGAVGGAVLGRPTQAMNYSGSQDYSSPWGGY